MRYRWKVNTPQVTVAHGERFDRLDALRGARIILGSAEALDRLAGLALEAPQELCGADSIHLDLRRVGYAGSVLAVVPVAPQNPVSAADYRLMEIGRAHV